MVAVMFVNCPVALLCVLQTVSGTLGSKCASLLSRGERKSEGMGGQGTTASTSGIPCLGEQGRYKKRKQKFG